MSDYPMLISNKLHSFRNFLMQKYRIPTDKPQQPLRKISFLHYLAPHLPATSIHGPYRCVPSLR